MMANTLSDTPDSDKYHGNEFYIQTMFKSTTRQCGGPMYTQPFEMPVSCFFLECLNPLDIKPVYSLALSYTKVYSNSLPQRD